MNQTSAQATFDKMYITSTEIGQELGVSRPAILNARIKGYLPNSIQINNGQITIWDREAIRPYIASWKQALDARRIAK